MRRPGTHGRSASAAFAGVGRLAAEQLDDPAGAVGVVERERALEAGADDQHVLPALACAARATASRLSRLPSSTSSQRSARRRGSRASRSSSRRSPSALAARRGTRAATRRRRSPRSGPRSARRRAAPSPSSSAQRARLARSRGSSRRARSRTRAPARSSTWPGERRRRSRPARSSASPGVKATWTRIPPTTLPRGHEQTKMYCYRHPNRETGVSCSECGRGDLPGLHGLRPGRDPLSGPRGRRAQGPRSR